MIAPHAGLAWKAVGGRLTLVLATIVALSVVAISQLAVRAFDQAMEPELASRTRLIGVMVRETIQRPLERGIPLDALAGLNRYLNEVLGRFEEVDSITISTADGRRIAEAERSAAPGLLHRALPERLQAHGPTYSLPILDGSHLVGALEVQVRADFLRTRLRDVFLDILVIALVATLIALELAFGLALATVGKPLRRVLGLLGEQEAGIFLQRIRAGGLGALGRVSMRLNDRAEDLAQRLAALPDAARARLPEELVARIAKARPARLRLSDIGDIRPALFLLSVSTEIAAAFLPVYARAASRPDWLSPAAAAAAPLLFYLVTVATLSPFGAGLSRRFGAQRLFIGAMFPIVLALAGMAFAGSVVEIAAWRGVIGLSYALATIACQEYALGAAEQSGASRALGGYLAVVYGGVFGGSALGGVIAGRFGTDAAFLLAAGLAAAAAVVAAGTMTGSAGNPQPAAPVETTAGARRGMPGLRYLALIAGITMPMHAATAIFVWYLVPITMAAAGERTADVARVVMLYYLATILLGPVVARLAERRGGPDVLVLLGGVGSGMALLSLTVWSGFWAMAAVVAGLGASHALMRAPQYVLALRFASQGGPGMGGLRLFERIGAITGLASCSVLLGDAAIELTALVLGSVILAGAVAFAVTRMIGPSVSALEREK